MYAIMRRSLLDGPVVKTSQGSVVSGNDLYSKYTVYTLYTTRGTGPSLLSFHYSGSD